MATDGLITRRMRCVEARRDHEGAIITFVCGHEQRSNYPASELIKMGQLVCFRCSRLRWQQMSELHAEIDRSADYGRVVRKLVALR